MSWTFTPKYLHTSDLHILFLRIHMTSACASSHLRSSHLRFSYRRIFNPHQQIIASQIFVSSRPQHLQIRISDLHILYRRLCSTSAHLHISAPSILTSSSYLWIFITFISYHLQDITMPFLHLDISTSSKPYAFKHLPLALGPTVV